MVVDDEPDIYDVLVTMFQLWGIDGVAFVDGAEAVQWVERVDAGTYTGELPVNAVIDVRLPGVEGHYVAQRIRRSPRLGNMAIVLITAYRTSPEQERQIMAISQADMLIEKPLPSMAEFRALLDGLVARRQAMAAAQQSAPEPGADAAAQPAAEAAPVLASETVAPVSRSSGLDSTLSATGARPKPQPSRTGTGEA
jgi:CheY-like chemotaxis protein